MTASPKDVRKNAHAGLDRQGGGGEPSSKGGYHLLRCDQKLSAGDADAGKLLVQGDNLLALKAMLPSYAGKVKCIRRGLH